jgi:propionate CoA-transferase
LAPKVATADEAAKLIPTSGTIGVCGCLSILEPDTVLRGIENRFLAEGYPRDLTVIHPVMVGTKGTGLNRLAHDGLLRRLIGGSFPIFPDYEISIMIKQDRVEAYSLGIGTILHWLRESGAGRPGLLTDVGLHTYIDPRFDGGRLNSAAKAPLAELVQLAGREWMFYPAMRLDAAVIRGSSADDKGNISVVHEPASLGIFTLALAAKQSGGTVIAQVRQLVESGSVHPRLAIVPSRLVDVVVVDPNQSQTAHGEHGDFTGELRSLLSVAPMPVTIETAIARRAMRELRDGQLVNLGYGIPALIPALGFPERLHERVHFSIEHGSIGGIPEGMALFGAAANPDVIMDSPSVFDMYDAGLLDITCLGMAQVDEEGNVNVSKFGPISPGSGGFCHICHRTKKIIFCGTFTAGGLQADFVNGRLVIRKEGRVKKFVQKVGQITMNGRAAREKGQEVLYITERAVFRLGAKGLELIELAPGIELEKEVLSHMEFPIEVSSNVRQMDSSLFARA